MTVMIPLYERGMAPPCCVGVVKKQDPAKGQNCSRHRERQKKRLLCVLRVKQTLKLVQWFDRRSKCGKSFDDETSQAH